MQRYVLEDDGGLHKADLYMEPSCNVGTVFYRVEEADAAITQLVTERDTALIAHSKLAVRVNELSQDNARWISARDVWTAEMKAKDERIKELERALQTISNHCHEIRGGAPPHVWIPSFVSKAWRKGEAL